MVERGGPHDGRAVRLRSILPRDIEFLYNLATSSDDIWRWRLRGRTPSPGDFESFVWSASDIQFIMERRQDGLAFGHVASYQTDELGGTTKLAMLIDPSVRAEGWPLEGAYLFLDYLFGVFPLRKVYLEVPAFNLSSLSGILRRFTVEEGRLVDHTFGEGAHCDLVIAAMWRSQWHELQSSAIGRAFVPRAR